MKRNLVPLIVAAGATAALAGSAGAQYSGETERLATCVTAKAHIEEVRRQRVAFETDPVYLWSDTQVETARRHLAELRRLRAESNTSNMESTVRSIEAIYRGQNLIDCKNNGFDTNGCLVALTIVIGNAIDQRLGFEAAKRHNAEDLDRTDQVLFRNNCYSNVGATGADTLKVLNSNALPIEDSEDWAGVYTDGRYEYTLTSPGGHEVEGRTRALFEENTGHLSSCKPDQSWVVCDGEGDYRDNDKSIHWTGYVRMSHTADSLRVTTHLQHVTFQWKVSPYDSAFHDGAEFEATLPRKKG